MVKNFVALLLTLFHAGAAEGRTARAPQPPRKAVDIPKADIETALQMSASMPVSDQQLRVVDVNDEYNVAVAIVHRAKTAGREIDPGAAHKEITEIYHVVSGRGTLVTGGTLEDPKDRPAANPLTGPTVQGTIVNGRMRALSDPATWSSSRPTRPINSQKSPTTSSISWRASTRTKSCRQNRACRTAPAVLRIFVIHSRAVHCIGGAAMISKGTKNLATAALATAAAIAIFPASAAEAPAAAVYGKYCASCHDQTGARIPTRDALTKLSPARILRTLDFGAMMSIAYPIKRGEREAVARFLGHGEDDPPPPASAFCKAGVNIMARPANLSWSGWSPDASNARFQSATNAGLAAADVPKLQLKWAYGFAGDVTAFGAPTILNGTIFVGSAGGAVQAIDAQTGCLHWMYQAGGPVRSAMAVSSEGTQTTLVFSDQNGWVHALDARSGKQLWRKRPEEHEATRLTGSPAVYQGVVFVPAASWEETRSIDPAYPCCTFRGSITALRARDGQVVWKSFLVDAPKQTGKTAIGTPTFGPSGAGVWSRPTVDAARGLLYITTGDNYSHPATATSDAIMALDIKTGRIAWSQQTTPKDVYNSSCGAKGANCPEEAGPDYDYGSSAILVKTAAGKDVLVAGQKSGVVYALDPDAKGKLLWQTRVGKGGTNGGVQWGMASDGRNLYASVSDVVRPPGGIGGPAAVGNANLDPNQGGGLTALDLATGNKVWFAPGTPCNPARVGCSPAQPGAVTAIPGAVFSGAMDGHIRAFSTADGHLLWDYDTEKSYTTVNGVSANGGSLDGAGPVVAGGMVYVNSGYPRFGGAPGNVLLAFVAGP